MSRAGRRSRLAAPGVKPCSTRDLRLPRPGWAPVRGTASDTTGARTKERRICSNETPRERRDSRANLMRKFRALTGVRQPGGVP